MAIMIQIEERVHYQKAAYKIFCNAWGVIYILENQEIDHSVKIISRSRSITFSTSEWI